MPSPFSYPEELQAEGVRLHREEGMSLRQIGERLGVTAQAVHKWVRKADATDPVRAATEDKAEIRRLQRELRRTQQERDILKKAVAFFARESEGR
jgi:transposase